MSLIRQLEASRRLESQLSVEKHYQEMERKKIQAELDGLRRSRQNFIDTQITNSKRQYEDRLNKDPELAKELKHRHDRENKQKSKIAQSDFEQERQRLLIERNEYDNLDKEYRSVEKCLLSLQIRSKEAQDSEEKKILSLEIRKNDLIKLLEESKLREITHFQKAKQLLL